MSESLLLLIIGGALSVFWTILVLLVRSWTNEAKEAVRDLKDTIKELFGKIDKIVEREAACKAELPARYATKADLRVVERQTEDNARQIASLAARVEERANV